MSDLPLEEMTVAQLVDRFADIGVAQDKAILFDNTDEYNSLYHQMSAINNALCLHGREARLALLRLFNHKSPQVRLMSAIDSLAVAPVAARAVLEQIGAHELFPYNMDAHLILNDLNNGKYIPK